MILLKTSSKVGTAIKPKKLIFAGKNTVIC
jgi:hypothetical protein